MKTTAVILTILLTRFAYLRAESEAEGFIDLSNLITRCKFDPKTIKIFMFNQNNPSGVEIGMEQRCKEIDKSKPVVLLIHGFNSNANNNRFYHLSQAMVEKRHTVFALDWSEAACVSATFSLMHYSKAVKHTRETAQLLADYILRLIDQCKIPLDKIMLIGHSLGAHISGFAAKKIQEIKREKVARIIGADPASPDFWNNSCEQRLCKTDAKRVIILHSSQLGIADGIGHLDYYFNGQYVQPGCSFYDIVCTHSRPLDYLTAMLKNQNCAFPARPKSSKLDIPDSTTTDCTTVTSSILDLTKLTREEGDYQLWVASNEPYCTQKQLKCKQKMRR